jgi:hypothetical protein
MYCGKCRGEYRDGIDECPICGEPLRPEPPAEGPRRAIGTLPTAATLAMIGTGAIFLIRTVATINPVFNLTVIRASSMLYLVAQAFIIYFFIVFMREGVEKVQWRLKLATCAALAGCVTAAVIVALNLLILFDRPIVYSHSLGVASNIASMLIPVTSVLFFAGFLADMRSVSARMSRAARFALVGSLLSAAAHGASTVLFGPNPVMPGNVTPFLFLVGFPIVAFAVGTWLYFLRVIRTDLAP